LLCAAPGASSADLWEGSVVLASDYLVRGISRSDHDPALQLDFHYVAASGLIAGASAANTRIDPQRAWTAELNGYLGLAWLAGSDWHGKLLAAYYGYPRSTATDRSYDYGEVDLDLIYRQWLGVSLSYSPAAPRFGPGDTLERASSKSLELNLQQPLRGSLAGTAGIGYDRFAGGEPAGFVYWSLGLTYTLAPVSLSLSLTDTNGAAKSLFYDNATHGRWIATVLSRF
jgi:uncharacterized protein (TIGR02001 family)